MNDSYQRGNKLFQGAEIVQIDEVIKLVARFLCVHTLLYYYIATI